MDKPFDDEMRKKRNEHSRGAGHGTYCGAPPADGVLPPPQAGHPHKLEKCDQEEDCIEVVDLHHQAADRAPDCPLADPTVERSSKPPPDKQRDCERREG